MTVKELIVELEKLNPDAELYSEDSGTNPISEIEDYSGDNDYYVIR